MDPEDRGAQSKNPEISAFLSGGPKSRKLLTLKAFLFWYIFGWRPKTKIVVLTFFRAAVGRYLFNPEIYQNDHSKVIEALL